MAKNEPEGYCNRLLSEDIKIEKKDELGVVITHAIQPRAELINGGSPRPPFCPERMAQVRGDPTKGLQVFSFGEIDTFGILNGVEGIDVAEGID